MVSIFINENEIKDIINDLCAHDSIQLTDIPNIYLYMDQVTTFFDENLSHLKRNPEDKILTKTMINNYTNANILFPSEKKKYNRQHITILVLIYYLKQIMSINDIHKLLSPITEKVNLKKEKLLNIDKLYNIFLELEKAELNDFKEHYSERINRINIHLKDISTEDEETMGLIILILMLVIQANIQKTIAEKLIDQYFNNKK